MLLKTGILLASTAALLALQGCNLNDQTKAAVPAKGGVAATVNGTPISAGRVDMIVSQGAAQGRPDTAEVRKEIIENLAVQIIAAQEAVKKGLDKTPEVTDQIELAHQSILASAFVRDYMKSNPVSDDMIKAEYEKIKAQTSGTEYKARHILVDKEADAKDIIAKLKKNPKSFEALATEKSKDPGSKAHGGDLGWFDPRGMVPEFGAAVAKLAKGKFTEEPVKSQFGYHVILLEDSRPKQGPTLEQIKPMLEKQLQQQSLRKLLDDMKAKAKIEIVKADAAATNPPKEGKPAEPASK